jgi:hypothetical protein
MLNVPVHGPTRPEPLLRSIKRHLYAENCSARTPHHLLIAVRQADTFLRGRGTSVHAPPGPTSRRSWACSSARACSARAGSRDGCAASSSSARSLGPPALPWVPLTGRRPRPRTRPRPSADQTWTPHEPPGSAPTARRRAGLTRPAPNRPAAGQRVAGRFLGQRKARVASPGSTRSARRRGHGGSYQPLGLGVRSGLSSAARSSACVAARHHGVHGSGSRCLIRYALRSAGPVFAVSPEATRPRVRWERRPL